MEVPQSQPDLTGLTPAAAAVESFTRGIEALPEPAPQPETPAAPTPEAAPIDPATLKAIPDDVAVPKHLEKYKGKSLADFDALVLRTEQFGTQKAQEAARLARENAELQARLAAAEQVTRMTQPAPQQPADPWQSRGVDLNVDSFTDPQKTHNATVSIAEERARAVAQAESQKAIEATRAMLNQQAQANAAVQTFEAAREQLNKEGYVLTQEQWAEALQFIAPVVDAQSRVNPAVMFDPASYTEPFKKLRGAPIRPTIPSEGNPPVASRTAAPQATQEGTKLTREEAQLNKRIRAALGLPD